MAQTLLTPEQAANRLAVSPKSIREWLRTGRLKGAKAGRLWRIREDDLENFLAGKPGERAQPTLTDDPILAVIGCLSGESLSSIEIEQALYGPAGGDA